MKNLVIVFLFLSLALNPTWANQNSVGDGKGSFLITPPIGWYVNYANDKNRVIVYNPVNKSVMMSFESTDTALQINPQQINAMRNTFMNVLRSTGLRVQLQGERAIEWAGASGYYFEFKAMPPPQARVGVKVDMTRAVYFFLTKGKRTWIIGYTSPEQDVEKYNPKFQAVLKSLKLARY